MNGRSLVRLLLVLILGVTLAAPAAQVMAQGTPIVGGDNPFADLGLPQIDITMTDTAFEGVPGELAAGRYVVSLTNESSSPEMSGGTFMQIPEGMTTEDFMAMASPPMSSPTGDMAPEGSPGAEGGEGEIPAWFYEAVIAGGPFAAHGETGYAVIELAAGDWVWWAESPGAPQAPVAIAVTGEVPADDPTPIADVRVEMSEFAFSLDAEISAGPVVIELANVGEQPHFMLLGAVPAGTTEDDVLALLTSMFGGEAPMATPDDALAFEDVTEVFSHGNQSGDMTAWYAAELDPGTHVAICFIPDLETGMPHVMLGMIEVFEVS